MDRYYFYHSLFLYFAFQAFIDHYLSLNGIYQATILSNYEFEIRFKYIIYEEIKYGY